MDTLTDVSLPVHEVAEMHMALILANAALYDHTGRVCVPRDVELELRAEIGRLSDAIRRAEAEARR